MTLKVHSISQSMTISSVNSEVATINALPFSILENIQNFLELRETAQITHFVSRLWRLLRRNDGCLKLCGSKINDIGFKQLVNQYNGRPIRSLHISCCLQLGNASASILSTLTSLTDLDLGSKYLNYRDALSDLPINKLRFTSSRGGFGTYEDLCFLTRQRLPLKELTFACMDIWEFSLGSLSMLSLESLDLEVSDASNITDERLHDISFLPLRSLALSLCSQITDVGIKWIAKQPIHRLSLSDSQIGGVALGWISMMPLQDLSLINCKNINQIVFSALRNLSLTRLELTNCNDSAQSLKYFNPTLTALRLTGPQNFRDKDVEMLCRFPLRDLILTNCPEITDTGIQYLSKLSLNYLDIVNCLQVTSAPSGFPSTCAVTYINTCKTQTRTDSCIIT